MSCQREEQLFQLGFAHRGRAGGAFPGDAPPKSRGDDFEPGAIQCTGDRSQLSDNVLALAALFDHGDHARELPLRAAQAVQYSGDAVFVPNHWVSLRLSGNCNAVPTGVYARLVLNLTP